MVREVWPSVVEAQPGLAALGQKLISSVFLAPLGWLLLAPLFFKKILPFLSKRYTLTNRRLMIQRGLKPQPVQEVALADIDDVRIAADSHLLQIGDAGGAVEGPRGADAGGRAGG
jgi:hypothetical protein